MTGAASGILPDRHRRVAGALKSSVCQGHADLQRASFVVAKVERTIEALMGEPVRTIVGEAEARDVDLIVLGAPAQLEVDAKLGKRASSFAGFDGS